MPTRQIINTPGFTPDVADTVMVIDTDTKDIRLIPWQQVLNAAGQSTDALTKYETVAMDIGKSHKIGVLTDSKGNTTDVNEALTFLTGTGNILKYVDEAGTETDITLDKVYDTDSTNLAKYDSTKGLLLKATDVLDPDTKNLLKATNDKLSVLASEIKADTTGNLITESTDGKLEILADSLKGDTSENVLTKDSNNKLQVLGEDLIEPIAGNKLVKGSTGKLQVIEDGTVPTWLPNTYYTEGTLVANGGETYRVGRDHTSTDSFSIDIIDSERLTSIPEGATNGDGIGSTTAVSKDGKVYVIGGGNVDADTIVDVGSVHITTRDDKGVWNSAIKLQGTDLTGVLPEGGSKFGASFAISEDGSKVIIGSPGHKASTGNFGSAFMYSSADNYAAPIKQFTSGTPELGMGFGGKVRSSSDGTVVAIGSLAVGDDVGEVEIFTDTNGVWDSGFKLSSLLIGGDVLLPNERFGANFVLSGNGKILYAIASGKGPSGTLYTFAAKAGGWSLVNITTLPDTVTNTHYNMTITNNGLQMYTLALGDTLAASTPMLISYSVIDDSKGAATRIEDLETLNNVDEKKSDLASHVDSLHLPYGLKDCITLYDDDKYLLVANVETGTKNGYSKWVTNIPNNSNPLLATYKFPDTQVNAGGNVFSSDNAGSLVVIGNPTGGVNNKGSAEILNYVPSPLYNIKGGFKPAKANTLTRNYPNSIGMVPATVDTSAILTTTGWMPKRPKVTYFKVDIDDPDAQQSFIANPNTKMIEVEMCGGGGGAGIVNNNSDSYSSMIGFGGSGAYLKFRVYGNFNMPWVIQVGAGAENVRQMDYGFSSNRSGVDGNATEIEVNGDTLAYTPGGKHGTYNYGGNVVTLMASTTLPTQTILAEEIAGLEIETLINHVGGGDASLYTSRTEQITSAVGPSLTPMSNMRTQTSTANAVHLPTITDYHTRGYGGGSGGQGRYATLTNTEMPRNDQFSAQHGVVKITEYLS